MKKLFLLLVTVLSLAITASAQTRTVSGTVVDEQNDPIVGASVKPVGSKTGVVTDLDGNFAIQVPSTVKALEISNVGYTPQTVTITGGRLFVTLKTSVEMKDEVLVVAYGTAKRSEYTGSASVVKAEQLENTQVSNVTNALSGKVSGVQTLNSNGQPGTGSSVLIRGVGSINAGTSPLYVVDGVPFDGDISAIPTSDIAELTVLKDAASTALYGARGANGVILVTTKRGKEGEARVVFDMKWGQNSRALANYNTIDDPREYIETLYKAIYQSCFNFYGDDKFTELTAHRYANDNIWSSIGYQTWTIPNGEDIVGRDGKFNPNATPGYVRGNYMYLADDWRKLNLRTGLRQEYNFSVTGGTQKLNYYLSASYLGDQGIIDSSHYKRFSTRANVEYQAKPWLKIGANMNYAYSNQGYPGDQTKDEATSVGNAFNAALHMGPVYPMFIRDPQGNLYADASTGHAIYDYGDGKDYGWGRTPSRNNMSSSNPLGDFVYDREEYLADDFYAKWFMNINPIEGLNIVGTAGYQLNVNRLHYIKNRLYGSGAEYGGQAIQASDRSRSISLNALASYTKTFNDLHTIDVMLSFENQSFRTESVEASGNNLYNPFSFVVDNTIDNKNGYGAEYSLVHRGVLGRVKYNYAGKYYVVGSIRRDGSSRFAPGHRWGTFWSASAGWDISKEDFLKESTAVDMLKLKFSFGQTGNDGIGTNYLAYADQYRISGADGIWSDGVLYYKGNRDITWETSNSLNAGFDFSFFKGKLSGTIEYFQRQTSDMLFNVPVAPSLGYSSVPMNVGAMRNAGVELDLNYNALNTKDLSLDIYANITTGWNKVLKLEQKLLNRTEDWRPDSKRGWLSGSRWFAEGESMYQYYLVQYAGVNNVEGYKTPDGKEVGRGEAMYWALRTKTDKDGNPVVYSYKKDDKGNFVYDDKGNKIPEAYVKEEYKTNNYTEAYNTNRKSTGNMMPKAYGGFGIDLKAYGFDLNVACAYQFGGKVIDSGYQTYMSPFAKAYVGQAYHKDLLNAWTPTNTNTDVPRLGYETTMSAANSTSDRFLISSNYLSLNNVTLGYTLPAKLTTRIGISDVRVYFSAENVALLSKRKGFDPRQSFLSSDNSTYSPIRTLSGGIRVGF